MNQSNKPKNRHIMELLVNQGTVSNLEISEAI